MDDVVGRLNAALQGRYHIERTLGEGGMATVYLADDLKHERKVAIKVLKPELAAVIGAERFLAEIKTTANLQHPHILPLFDSGEADSFLFYAMPYIEGETLRERIARDKQLPVDEAIGIAVGVANALHTAHEAGIVHRDIKPGNILMSQGEPLVADFGIALAVGSAGGSRLTETGLSVGTPYYMSPEQATGDQAIGPASDIYALAAVLYELLVGEPPYVGNTAQAVLGKILQGAPASATAVRKTIPLNIDAALRKALERLPADRFTSARDFARAMGDPSFRHGETEESLAARPLRSRVVAFAGWGIAAGLAVALGWATTRPEPAASVRRFSVPFLTGDEPEFLASRGYNLSPDGSMIVYRHVTDEGQILVTRRWDELGAEPIRNSAGASSPAVSPDGSRISFTTPTGGIAALALAGGPVVTLTDGGGVPRWGYDGFVYTTVGLDAVRVPAVGGPVEVLTSLDEGEIAHDFTDLLPSGDRALRQVLVGNDWEIRMLDLDSGAEKTLAFGTWGQYATSGHILYLADGTLMAAPIDATRMELTGPAVALIGDVIHFSLADDGTLFYSTGAGGGLTARPVWVTRSGTITPIDDAWLYDRTADPNDSPSLSPDGSMLAIREFTDDGYDIWVKRLDTGPRTRLTLGDAEERMATWNPSGDRVTFLSDRNGGLDVWSKRADGTGTAELLLDIERSIASATWSPDGTWLVVRTGGTPGVEGGRDILGFRPGVDSATVPLLTGAFDEVDPSISPDGRWIAYTSNESDRYDLYVRPFPNVNDSRVQVSVNGGFSPKWAHNGRELFFLDTNGNMVVSEVQLGDSFSAGAPSVLFEVPQSLDKSDLSIPYDVAPDDQRFVMLSFDTRNVDDDEATGPATVLVENFLEELKRRVPN